LCPNFFKLGENITIIAMLIFQVSNQLIQLAGVEGLACWLPQLAAQTGNDPQRATSREAGTSWT
jgi:hypothetical protein